ncbi:UvrD-helicase domain-containing protein [Chlamydiota bacterium]
MIQTTNKTPSHVFLVEASAGSGKTFELAKRYLFLLLNHEQDSRHIPIGEILAITFTNKATYEMKERVIALLKSIVFDSFASDEIKHDIIKDFIIDYRELQKRALLVLDYLLDNYDQFFIETIDGFMNSILEAYAYKLALSSQFEVRTDYRDFLRYSLDLFFDDASREDSIKEKLKDFITTYYFIENNTGWFPKRALMRLLDWCYCVLNIYPDKFRTQAGSFESIFEKKKTFLKDLQCFYHSLGEETYLRFRKGIETFLKNSRETFSLKNIPRSFAHSEIPIKKGEEIALSVMKKWMKIKIEAEELILLDAKTRFSHYLTLFSDVISYFEKYTIERDSIFVSELNKKVALMLSSDESIVPELYYRLATKFTHFLIDEFQDTSLLQWYNLKTMIHEALSSHGSLFCVGDSKQAIFRFRGGDASLFKRVKDDFRDYGITEKYLDKNFRSAKAIVAFNNQVFSRENITKFCSTEAMGVAFNEDDLAEIACPFYHSYQNTHRKKDSGYVQVIHFNDDTSSDIKGSIRKKLFSTLQSFELSQKKSHIAILVRDNALVEMISGWLLDEKKLVESERTLCLKNNEFIKEIISFLTFLDSPIDNVSFVTFILGDIFQSASGLSQEELHNFLFQCNKHRTRSEKETVYYYRLFQRKYPIIWETLIGLFLKNIGIFPLYDLIIEIYKIYRLPARFAPYSGFFMRLLELVQEYEDIYPDVSSFLEFFREEHDASIDYVQLLASSKDSIQVMTYHKAKGLEFDCVIVPFFGAEIKVPDKIVAHENGEMKLVYAHKNYVRLNAVLTNLYKEEYKKALTDELNTLYVALTRAQSSLYVFIPEKSGRAKNIFSTFIPDELKEIGNRTKTVLLRRRSDSTIRTIPVNEYQEWYSKMQDEVISSKEIINRKRIKEGEIIHSILSHIGNLYTADIDSVIESAIERTQNLFDEAFDSTEYKKKIKKIIDEKSLSKFFFIANGTVSSEKEVVIIGGKLRKIDRLIIADAAISIVEFKSYKQDSDEYRMQVVEYVAIMKSIYPKKDVSGYIVFLDNGEVEEVSQK